MYSNAYTHLEKEVTAVRSLLATTAALRQLLSNHHPSLEPSIIESDLTHIQSIAPRVADWTVLEHSATVSRLYALFEQFFENVVGDWVGFRTKGQPYNGLPEGFRKAYSEGFAAILSSTSRAQYAHLSEADMVLEYNAALTGENRYSLTEECITYHSNNLRWNDINDIFRRCGLDGFDQWVSSSTIMRNYFQSNQRIVEQAASKLGDFVQYRNDAAHGAVGLDEVLGSAGLEEYAVFIRSLSETIYQFLLRQALLFLELDSRAQNVGLITEKFSRNIAVGTLEGVTLSQGQSIYVVSDKLCAQRNVLSLRVADQDVPTAVLARPDQVGIALDGDFPLRAQIYVVPAR